MSKKIDHLMKIVESGRRSSTYDGAYRGKGETASSKSTRKNSGSRKVMDTRTGEVYDSQKEAAWDLGVSGPTITKLVSQGILVRVTDGGKEGQL